MLRIILKDLTISNGCEYFIQRDFLGIHLLLSMLRHTQCLCYCLRLYPGEQHIYFNVRLEFFSILVFFHYI